MSAVVADTHALVWYMVDNGHMSGPALLALDAATAGGYPIYVPTICLVEMRYLVEKGRLPAALLERIDAALDEVSAAAVAVPLDRAVVAALGTVPRSAVPEMADRIIAATAKVLGLPLVTKDVRLREAEVDTIW